MHRKNRIFSLVSLLIIACSMAPDPNADTGNLIKPAAFKSEVKLKDLTLREKIGQMIMVRVRGDFYNDENWYRNQLESWISETGIGGVITFGGSIHGSYYNIRQFQEWAEIPLLVAADYERGTGQWMTGGTLFPSNMAVAATGDTMLAYEQGRVTAAEGRALGVQVAFAPVVDVNNNQDNPIINFRAYSDDPEIVSQFGNSFIQGLQDNGMVACVKHFPGHGNTSVDSHSSLPSIKGSRKELEAVELKPFKQAVEAGVQMIMVGHIIMEGIDPSGTPASHSRKITTGLIRDQWNFDGIIVTDGMEMGGLTSTAWAGESAVRAVEAGADILLLPTDVGHTIDAIEAAVKSGRIKEKRINASVLRILEMKKNSGLFSDASQSDWAQVEESIGVDEHRSVARNVAAQSITVVKDDGLLPLKPEKINRLGHLILTTDENGHDQLKTFISDVSRTHGNVEEIVVNEALSDLRQDDIINRLRNVDQILVTLLVRIKMHKDLSTIDPTHAELLKRLHQQGKKLVVAGFGSPYLPDYESISTYLCAYGYGSISQTAAADGIWGRAPISGKLPVNLNKSYPRGHGLEFDRRKYGFEPSKGNVDLRTAVAILDSAISQNIFPGAQIFIAREGQIVLSAGYGNFTYDEVSPAVETNTIYDVASLTKVLVTTPVMMKMVGRKDLGLDQEVSQFYPQFTGGGREDVTLRHLLTHSSGLESYVQYFLDNRFQDKSDIIADILDEQLNFKPGTDFAYSDLGIILLGSIIEKVRRKDLDRLANDWVFNPMDMTSSGYLPDPKLLDRIAPTEFDSAYRGSLVHGVVHDENAYLMGGEAPHAGVFSTAEDIGKYAQMLLNGGTWLGSREFTAGQIRQFTKRQEMPPGSDRAVGWDTPSRNGTSSAGDYFSNSSFGHLGFTGTSMWVDPERDIIIVLLTNRVHPSRDKGGIYGIRRAFHTAVMRELLNT